MDNIIRAKINICDEARKTLIESNERTIIEDTEDPFWGRGKDGLGTNMLGQFWMLYRSKIKACPTGKVPIHHLATRDRHWVTRNSQPRCFRCGEPGHLLEQCRQRTNVSCWSCQQNGHKQKHCHLIRQGNNRSSQ